MLTHDVGQIPIAVGYLIDSRDIKAFANKILHCFTFDISTHQFTNSNAQKNERELYHDAISTGWVCFTYFYMTLPLLSFPKVLHGKFDPLIPSCYPQLIGKESNLTGTSMVIFEKSFLFKFQINWIFFLVLFHFLYLILNQEIKIPNAILVW